MSSPRSSLTRSHSTPLTREFRLLSDLYYRTDKSSILDLESKLGAGLIEEVIQVAEGEHSLLDTMIKSKVWEPLEEQAPEGQWGYFERSTHTATQKP